MPECMVLIIMVVEKVSLGLLLFAYMRLVRASGAVDIMRVFHEAQRHPYQREVCASWEDANLEEESATRDLLVVLREMAPVVDGDWEVREERITMIGMPIIKKTLFFQGKEQISGGWPPEELTAPTTDASLN